MALPNELIVKTAADFRDDGLRTLRNGLIRAGVPNPNVTPNSDYFLLFQAFGDELEVLSNNLLIKADAQMPDTAEAEDLDRWLDAVGLSRRTAAGSFGSVVLDSSAASLVAVGTQLIDGAGLRYQVVTGGTYVNTALIPIAGIDVGIATNHGVGDVLRWVAGPPFSAATALVAVGGLTGASEAEDDETARRRLLRRLANPPGSGNWPQVVEIAEASTPSVMAAFCYPAAQGPATTHVCVVAYPSATNKTRVLPDAILLGTVKPYILGSLAEHADTLVQTSIDLVNNVAIYLSLPAAASAGGPGGGWLDAAVFPRPVASDVLANAAFCDVRAMTDSTHFTVPSDVAPTVNATRICWLSPINWQVYSATVTAFTGTGPYAITIDKPFTGITVGQYISPQMVNQQAYFDALVEEFRLLGPTEKTIDPTILLRAYRRPPPRESWPYSLGAHQLKAITDVGDEVFAARYGYRLYSTPGPNVSITAAPNIFVPGKLAFYEELGTV